MYGGNLHQLEITKSFTLTPLKIFDEIPQAFWTHYLVSMACLSIYVGESGWPLIKSLISKAQFPTPKELEKLDYLGRNGKISATRIAEVLQVICSMQCPKIEPYQLGLSNSTAFGASNAFKRQVTSSLTFKLSELQQLSIEAINTTFSL